MRPESLITVFADGKVFYDGYKALQSKPETLKPKYFTIPLFIPMQGCPFDCVFCNQHGITGQQQAMDHDEIAAKVEQHLNTIPDGNNHIEIGFFGGSFTGLPIGKQRYYLQLVQPWIASGRVKGIRLSTRPDYIREDILEMLLTYGVKTIELGVQSMDDEVLKQSGRSYTTEDVHKAATMIKSYGFSMVLQMMIGLPGDTLEKSIQTAREIINLGADATRIYPTLVIRNTALEKRYRNGEYEPLSLSEAIDWCSSLVPLFEKAGAKILRLGLHPSESILHGNDLVAGPFHVAFGEMVYSKLWYNLLCEIQSDRAAHLTIFVNPKQLNYAVGYQATNRKMLEGRFRSVIFLKNEELQNRHFTIFLD